MASVPIQKPDSMSSSASTSAKLSVWTFVGVSPRDAVPMPVVNMILGIAFIACVLTVPLARGRLTDLADLELRRGWLALVGIAVQILVIEVFPGAPEWLTEGVHMLSYLLLGAFAWSNRRVPGVPVIILGGLLNFVAIVANGGVMPADPDLAVHVAGAEGFVNAGAVENPRLLFLGDVFATPSWFPLYNVFSVGDVLMVLGVLTLLHGASGSRLVPRRWRTPSLAGA
jgi:Family of unknown function (DUF5317)